MKSAALPPNEERLSNFIPSSAKRLHFASLVLEEDDFIFFMMQWPGRESVRLQ